MKAATWPNRWTLQIETLETRAREILTLISSLRNLWRPINRLPPEIISRIARGVPSKYAQDARSIIPLTHVCRYWRESIISAPENWTLVSSESERLAALSLERSKEAPLQIYLDMNQVRKKPGSVGLVTPYIHNVEALVFKNLVTVDDIIGTFPNFPQTMPNLRLLDLSLRAVSPNWVSTINPFGLFTSFSRNCRLRRGCYDVGRYPLTRVLFDHTCNLRFHRGIASLWQLHPSLFCNTLPHHPGCPELDHT